MKITTLKDTDKLQLESQSITSPICNEITINYLTLNRMNELSQCHIQKYPCGCFPSAIHSAVEKHENSQKEKIDSCRQKWTTSREDVRDFIARIGFYPSKMV